jgi:hypothetical protein
MNSLTALEEGRFTAGEVNLLYEVTDHLDVWIDRLWEKTDKVLRGHRLIPAVSPEVRLAPIKPHDFLRDALICVQRRGLLMATKKVTSRKGRASGKRRTNAAKKRKVARISKRSGDAVQLTKPTAHVEPVIDREREAALLESAIKEPC